MSSTTTVHMVRKSLPLMETIMSSLDPYPEARKAVVAAVADAEKPRNESAEVHIDEVENWSAHGWQLASAST